jgi:predicted O-linked N-acetylglucosamine transferase (SPINDLY family)
LPLGAIALIVPGGPASDNEAVLEVRRSWAERAFPAAERRQRPANTDDRPLRIGYVSSFFQDHNWMKPVWGLINHHDRRRFEVHLFSDAPASAIQDGYRADPLDRFHETAALSNQAVAQLIEHEEIDVLVDLNGYSTMRRLPLLAMRPAPVIVGWFNLYATTGIPAYDYLIGDDVVIPPDEEQYYTEKIARVPGSYLTFDVTYPVPDVADPQCLTTGAITFGSLASQYKITNQVIETWSRILHRVPGSSLVLKNTALSSPGAAQFVHDLFARHQILPERVRLFGPSNHYEFLETYSAIDIALDTFPYNGGTTTTEALWQGVPVVTFHGDRWASRTSASILQAAHLGEFVCQGLENYIFLAIHLASSPEILLDLRRSMRSRLCESPVCDTQAFARNMEQLYTRMVAGVASFASPG